MPHEEFDDSFRHCGYIGYFSADNTGIHIEKIVKQHFQQDQIEHSQFRNKVSKSKYLQILLD